MPDGIFPQRRPPNRHACRKRPAQPAFAKNALVLVGGILTGTIGEEAFWGCPCEASVKKQFPSYR